MHHVRPVRAALATEDIALAWQEPPGVRTPLPVRAAAKGDSGLVSEALEPCLGVMCSIHGMCAKYEAINNTRIPSDRWRAFCGTGDTDRPGFVPHAVLVPAQSLAQLLEVAK